MGMTEKELKLIRILVDAHNLHVEILKDDPISSHRSDGEEFDLSIHTLQNMILSRLAVRTHKDIRILWRYAKEKNQNWKDRQ